jgi:hypothetical protein
VLIGVYEDKVRPSVVISVIAQFDPNLGSEKEKYFVLNAASVERDEFEFAGGLRGERLRAQHPGGPDPPTEARTSYYYVVDVGPRRFELEAWCPTLEVPTREPRFDEIARSLRFFEPFSDPPLLGTWKNGRARGLAFEYPGDWEWQRPANDWRMQIAESVRLVAPGYNDQKFASEPTVTLSRDVPRPKDPPFESAMAELCRSSN